MKKERKTRKEKILKHAKEKWKTEKEKLIPVVAEAIDFYGIADTSKSRSRVSILVPKK
jgi:hypothetical protein